MVSLIDKLASKELLRSAWRALHKNPHSYGIDKVTIDDFRDNLEYELDMLASELKAGTYKPKKLRGHPLEKGKYSTKDTDKKEYRILKIPTVRDRVVQKSIEILISTYLDKKYHIVHNGVSFAYMKEGGVEKAALQVKKYYESGYPTAYCADIRKFFDEINNEKLLLKIKNALPDDSLISLIELFLKIDISNARQLEERIQMEYEYDPRVGVAQGSPLSPLFANVYLAEFDEAAKKEGLNLVRYADDMVIMCKSVDAAVDAHGFVSSELDKVDLVLHDLLKPGELPKDGHEKHSVISKYSGLVFLGLRFSGSKIYPSAASYNSAVQSVRRAAYNHKLSFVQKLSSIDARVQGWCASYSFADYLNEPTKKDDKLLEDILSKVLGNAGLKVKAQHTAMEAVGIKGYSMHLLEQKSKKEAKNKNKKKKNT